MKKSFQIITGTGRSGTTLFLELAAALGKTRLTGVYNEEVRGGLEPWPPLENHDHIDNIPPIVKDPRFLITTDKILKKFDCEIKHAYLLVRDFEQASLSRMDKEIYFSSYTGMEEQYGEDYHKKQIVFYQRAIGKFIETIALNNIPLTILEFPRFATDIDYTFQKLKNTPMGCSYSQLEYVFNKIVSLDLIHKFKRD